MRGLVLSGGRGTRLRPITHSRAKQLVPVAGRPVLHHVLDALAAVGVTEVGVVVGETGDEVRASVGDGSAWGLAVTFVDQDEPRGLADAVLVARDFAGDEDLLMVLGDNLLEHGLHDLVARRAVMPDAAAHILLAEVDDPRPFGVAEIAPDGRVVRLVEKPADPPSPYALVGAYLFGPEIHEAVRAISPSARGELEVVDAIQWLIDTGAVVDHAVLRGWWVDVGKESSLLEANRRVLAGLAARLSGSVDGASTISGAVVVEAGATVVASTLVGPAVVGRGARVRDSVVGPAASIGAGAEVLRSEVVDSVLMDGVRLADTALVESLVGSGTVVSGGRGDAPARLVVGDDSLVERGVS